MKPTNKIFFWSLALLALGCSSSGGFLSCSGRRDTPTTSTRGVEGGACRDWPSPSCDPGLECRFGVCRGCADEGEHCCGNVTCNAGLTCEWNASVDNVSCEHCGEPGERCCDSRWGPDNVCNAPSMCDLATNVCTGGVASGPCSGSATFFVGVSDQFGCFADVLAVASDSPSEAVECAQSRIPFGYTAHEVGSSTAEHEFCQTTPIGMVQSTVTVTTFEESDALSCAISTCINCEYTEGPC